ncbi:hypothetical protein [Streptomyces hilarionis]|uniref:hypothetical protein n=1 Tax=Streptomyces hilarionis TaxID=2839954 RepID=UPI00211A1924|nr:hypothetical protein [Streptomyces hilarionis]MCQ9129559.1 hypothetical protein [Streptomyces hilarionis]
MAPPTDEPAVVSYGTRASTTRVVRRGPHLFHWHRTPGGTALKAVGPPPGAVLRLLEGQRAGSAVHFAVPRWGDHVPQHPAPHPRHGRELVYELPDSVSIGWHMLAGAAVPRQYVDVMLRVGEATRTLHETRQTRQTRQMRQTQNTRLPHVTHRAQQSEGSRTPGARCRPVPWLGGLRDWLLRRPDALSERLVRRLGGDGWGRLVQWAEDAAAVPGGVVLGTLSPGVIVVDARDRSAHVLVGAEAGQGGPELDVGALAEALSTSVDVARAGAHHGPDELDYPCLWQAFVSGYGPGRPGGVLVRRAAVLRRVHRLRGMSGHIGDNAPLRDLIDRLPELVEREGGPLIPAHGHGATSWER